MLKILFIKYKVNVDLPIPFGPQKIIDWGRFWFLKFSIKFSYNWKLPINFLENKEIISLLTL